MLSKPMKPWTSTMGYLVLAWVPAWAAGAVRATPATTAAAQTALSERDVFMLSPEGEKKGEQAPTVPARKRGWASPRGAGRKRPGGRPGSQGGGQPAPRIGGGRLVTGQPASGGWLVAGRTPRGSGRSCRCCRRRWPLQGLHRKVWWVRRRGTWR